MMAEIYSIKDTKVGYAQPFILHNDQEAKRAFKGLIREEESNLHKWPQDYELWNIGQWDDELGVITTTGPKFLLSGMDCIKK